MPAFDPYATFRVTKLPPESSLEVAVQATLATEDAIRHHRQTIPAKLLTLTHLAQRVIEEGNLIHGARGISQCIACDVLRTHHSRPMD